MKLDLKKEITPKKLNIKKVPTKRNINFATVGQKPIDKRIAIPSIVVIVVLAALFSKFFVTDRLYALYKANSEVSALQNQVDEGYAALDQYDELNSEYAHYTDSGMTDEELSLVNRGKVIDLLNTKVRNKATVTGYTIVENEVTVQLANVSLESANNIANDLEKSDIVAVCSVETAKKSSQTSSNEPLTATLVIDLQEGGEENEN